MASDRSYWVVSPNVRNTDSTVPDWREASLLANAAFMGFAPQQHRSDRKKQGPKFAGTIGGGIQPGDVVLIARRFRKAPQVVGFGVVKGSFVKQIRRIKTPQTFGSARHLSPFIALTSSPPNIPLLDCLRHTTALAKLHPEREPAHAALRDWMDKKLSGKKRGGKHAAVAPSHRTIKLGKLSHSHELEYQTRTSAAILTAQKKEAELVEKYEKWLNDQDRTLHVRQYGKLRCDAFELARKNLIEAKSSSDREYIRMAVGQLLDYGFQGRQIFGNPNMAILVPEKPSGDLFPWLSALKISVVWRKGKVFLDNANAQFT